MHLALAVQTPDVSLSLPVALLSGTWSDKVEKAAQLGVDGLELMTADPGRLQAAEIRGPLEAHRLTVVRVIAVRDGVHGVRRQEREPLDEPRAKRVGGHGDGVRHAHDRALEEAAGERRPLAKRGFAERLERHGFAAAKGAGGVRVRSGIALREQQRLDAAEGPF